MEVNRLFLLLVVAFEVSANQQSVSCDIYSIYKQSCFFALVALVKPCIHFFLSFVRHNISIVNFLIARMFI